MTRLRRCDKRCHEAKGTRCKCWCGGFYHGEKGKANREAFKESVKFLDEHGNKKGEAYFDQTEMQL